MTDWHRMEWQYKANRWAVRAMLLCVLMMAPEVMAAFRYHFPWWDDFALVFTFIVMAVGRFVQKHTEMYRWDH